MSIAEELPGSQHGSFTIIFQQGFDVKRKSWSGSVSSEVYFLWWSMIVGIDNGSGR
jgi:hypothetical protein